MSKKPTRKRSKSDNDDILLPKYKARRLAAFAAVARKYCDWFGFWRDCRYKPCRSARRCVGDQGTCLKNRWASVPYAISHEAEMRMLAEMPPDADRFMRLACYRGPYSLLLHNPAETAKTEALSDAEQEEKSQS
jgi:hypothetical protein